MKKKLTKEFKDVVDLFESKILNKRSFAEKFVKSCFSDNISCDLQGIMEECISEAGDSFFHEILMSYKSIRDVKGCERKNSIAYSMLIHLIRNGNCSFFERSDIRDMVFDIAKFENKGNKYEKFNAEIIEELFYHYSKKKFSYNQSLILLNNKNLRHTACYYFKSIDDEALVECTEKMTWTQVDKLFTSEIPDFLVKRFIESGKDEDKKKAADFIISEANSSNPKKQKMYVGEANKLSNHELKQVRLLVAKKLKKITKANLVKLAEDKYSEVRKAAYNNTNSERFLNPIYMLLRKAKKTNKNLAKKTMAD